MPTSKHGYPRPLILKNGDEVELRPLDPKQDEERLFEFFSRIPEHDRWYMVNDIGNPEIVRHYLLNHHPQRALPIVAVDEKGRIVGKATLNRYHPGARGHVGKMRVVLDPNYRRQRLGTYLILDMVQLGVNLGLTLMMSEFIVGVEDQGIRAARRQDFFEAATIKDYAKDPRGNNYDLLIMTKRLHRGWDDF